MQAAQRKRTRMYKLYGVFEESNFSKAVVSVASRTSFLQCFTEENVNAMYELAPTDIII